MPREFSLVIISPTALAVSLDFNSKLQGLINELRGEYGAVLRGNKDAKDRLLKSECIDTQACSVTLNETFNSMFCRMRGCGCEIAC